MTALARMNPEIRDVLRAARRACPHTKGSLMEYQGAALYSLAKPFDGGKVLEIGTLRGYSAAVLAQACPKAEIVTLNPAPLEVGAARESLMPWPNVQVLEKASWDYLKELAGTIQWDVIFVDGDHNRITHDLPWFNGLRVGGLMLFRDYTPIWAGPGCCPPVFEALNWMARRTHPFDVLIVDENEYGMAGIYRREGESW